MYRLVPLGCCVSVSFEGEDEAPHDAKTTTRSYRYRRVLPFVNNVFVGKRLLCGSLGMPKRGCTDLFCLVVAFWFPLKATTNHHKTPKQQRDVQGIGAGGQVLPSVNVVF